MTQAAPVMICAGGTGGHVYPALSVARSLHERGIPVVWLGTRLGIEARLVPNAGIPIAWLTVTGLRGKGRWTLVKAPFLLLYACWQAWRAMRQHRPMAVLGMGGFVAGPGGVVARLTGRPLVIHEQNAVAGLTNRLLARIAKRTLAAVPGAFDKDQVATWVGNPIREELLDLPSPQSRLSERDGPMRLFVLGGSLGAQVFNEVVPEALAQLGSAVTVKHQTGKSKLCATQENYQKAGVHGDLMEFVDDMDAAYAWADVVLCRAGAMTVAEIAAVGVASILVPYPHAVDDHQSKNASFLAEAKAGVMMAQTEFSASTLALQLKQLIGNRNTLIEMAKKARALAKTDATERVVDQLLEVSR